MFKPREIELGGNICAKFNFVSYADVSDRVPEEAGLIIFATEVFRGSGGSATDSEGWSIQ